MGHGLRRFPVAPTHPIQESRREEADAGDNDGGDDLELVAIGCGPVLQRVALDRLDTNKTPLVIGTIHHKTQP